MNIAYYYEFRGLDNVFNRVEILTNSSVTAKEVTGTGTPFVLTYSDAKKLDPVQGAGATIGLVSHEVFEFVSLHTDDMQGYMIKMYRAGKLYWVGWLDPELYEEQLSDYPPYPVEFTAADFNVLERLKYKDENDANYTDIVSMKEHLKRCLSALALPFEKIYIGCSTTAEGITLSDSETVLDKLYVMSANFYDEENEPMSCREVIESILQPFGLMMVQRDGNIYIYDYNTIEDGLSMKCYNYANWTYEGLQTPEHNHGDLSNIGFMSTEGSYGFEEMKNNVTITSSIYASSDNIAKYEVVEKKLEDIESTEEFRGFYLKRYKKCDNWKNGKFLFYESKTDISRPDKETLYGAEFKYTGDSSANNEWIFEDKKKYLVGSDSEYYIRVKAEAYINTREDPFDSSEREDDERTRGMVVYGDLILLDAEGNPTKYFVNTEGTKKRWEDINIGSIPTGKFGIPYASIPITKSRIANGWRYNGNGYIMPSGGFGVDASGQTDGYKVPVPEIGGYLTLILRYAVVSNPTLDHITVFPADRVQSILIRNVAMSLEDDEGNSISTDDYEFDSYVNKKVKSDFDEVTLKCISANEEKAPIGKANILKKVDKGFKFQLSYTRAGQTNILERLLMCTIHSNYSQKNSQFECTLHLKGNPIMGYVTYNKFLKGNFLVTGAELNFRRATMTLSCVGFSKDVAKLSDIPYD